MTFINCVNVKLSGKLQAGCAFITTTSLGVIIFVGVIYIGKGTEHFIHVGVMTRKHLPQYSPYLSGS